jgi:hypothetical protein
MRGREAGILGGLVAALGIGGRFVDDCGRVGMRGASHMDDLGRRGAGAFDGAAVRHGGALGDDATRRGGALGDDATLRGGALGDGGALGARALGGSVGEGESLGARLIEDVAVEGAEFSIERFTGEDLSDDEVARWTKGAGVAVRVHEPQLLESRDPVRKLIRMGVANPVGMLVESTADPSALLRACVEHNLACIVLMCPPKDLACAATVRDAWEIAGAESERIDAFLQVLYAELRATDTVTVHRLHASAGDALDHVTVPKR